MPAATHRRTRGHVLARRNWQMALGERAAIEGLLAQLSPTLAIEIGTAQGGSLERIASHATEVHTFDMDCEVDPADFANVTFHIGDSHVLLPAFLAELQARGRTVDFALVDGDHTARGAQRDVEDLLRSPAVRNAFIVLHDTMNEEVLEGLRRIDFAAYPNVVFRDLAFTQLFRDPARPLEEAWGGLGLIVVDTDGVTGVPRQTRERNRSTWAGAQGALWHAASPARHARRELRHVGGRALRRAGLR
jgi:Methyltransferase domain